MYLPHCLSDTGSSTLQSAFRDITYPVVLCNLLYWIVFMRGMLWGMRAEQTQQARVSLTEVELYHLVYPTHLLGRAR